CHQYSSLPLTF
nr:immunoglobulin light chain junction region [Macaca mulatta]